MKNHDKKVLQEIQRNAQMAIDAIEEVSDKIYDKDFMNKIRSHESVYEAYGRKTLQEMGKEKIEPYREKAVEKMMLKSGIMMNTMMDVSTSHIAQMMIQGNNRGITDLCKVLNHNPEASRSSVELAKELMDFEEKAINSLKKYL